MDDTNTWTVVKFKEDDSVAAVPTTWINNDGCWWPPFRSQVKISAALSKHQKPDLSWPLHPIELFKNATYNSYEVARAKAKKSEDTSDLNSDMEEISRRRRVQNRFLCSDESASEVESDPQTIKNPPRLKNIYKEPEKSDQLVTAPATSKSTVTTPATSKPTVTTPATSKPTVATPVTSKPTLTTPITSKHGTMLSDLGSCQNCCPHQTKFLREILWQQQLTRTLLNDVLLELKSKNEYLINRNHEMQESVFVEFNLPIFEEEQFMSLNVKLKDVDTFEKAVNEITKIGGKDNFEFVKRCLSFLISNSLAVKYSWLGRRDKADFHTLEISRLIIEASLKANRATDAKQTETSIQNWLRRAKDRIK